MRNSMIRSQLFVVLLALSASISPHSLNGVDDIRPISNVPLRIRQPGRYRLVADLEYGKSTGAAIIVETDGVSLDLNGKKLIGTAGDATSAQGILAVDCNRISVSNGHVEGFYFGIDIRAGSRANPQSTEHRVENVRLHRNRYFGIRLIGTKSVIHNCRITDTGGSTKAGHTIPHAVRLIGNENRLQDCCIRDMRLRRFLDGKGEIVAVHFDAAKNSVMQGNVIVELTNDADSAASTEDHKERSFAVWVNGGERKDTFLRARDNIFWGFTVPFAFTPGTDGEVTGNVFHNAAKKPIRGRPASQLGENRISTTPEPVECR